MSEKRESDILFAVKLKYRLVEKEGNVPAEGEAEVSVERESFSLLPRMGMPFRVELRDISELYREDYQIFLPLVTGETFVFFHLGHRYDDLFRELVRLRNELILRDLLMEETLQKGGIQAEVLYRGSEGSLMLDAPCEIRLYETALVLLPETGEVLRVPYSFIANAAGEDYTITVETDGGEELFFSRMGRHYELFQRNLSEAMNRVMIRTQEVLRELFPGLSSSQVWQASRLLKEGRACRKEGLMEVSPDLWEAMERRLEEAGLGEEYAYLRGLAANPDHIYIGLKRGLMGDLSGDYFWFLISLYQLDSHQPGNAVAMEAISPEGGGKATYLFRITGRGDYCSRGSLEELEELASQRVESINRCMVAVNFRREPIYLPGDKLDEPRYRRYRFAVERMPELQELRRSFLGRVMHHSPEQWKKDVRALLDSQANALEDEAAGEQEFPGAGGR